VLAPRRSLAEELARLPPHERDRELERLSDGDVESLLWDWRFWARPAQLAPPGAWSTWLLRAGRGFGKTRAGSGWVHERAMAHPGRWIALLARTPADARDYMVEGPGGFLRNIGPRDCPKFEPSKRRLTWPNGSWATIYSDEEPDQVRGFSGDTAWIDEFGKFRNPGLCWSNLAFGMREGSSDRPRRLVTTTPRPIQALRDIEAMPSTVTVEGSSYDNRSNLDPSWYADVIAPYEGTRLGDQEIHGRYVEDVVGALFTRDSIDRVRCSPEECPPFTSTVISIDPSGAGTEDRDAEERRPRSDEVGIVAASMGTDSRAYLREDLSVVGPPEIWGARAVAAFHAYHADHVVAEANFGGDMVAYVIRSIDSSVPVRVVRASVAKHIRAEPVSALYSSQRDGVRHAGVFHRLEDQLGKFTTLGYEGPRSPDRADAWIWAATDLCLASNAQEWIDYYRTLRERVAASTPEPRDPSRPWGTGQAPAAEPVDNLTDFYNAQLRSVLDPRPTTCKYCREPLGARRITDGIDSWHEGCRG